MLSTVELMEHHVATLFRHDPAGRMIEINDIVRLPAPRLYLGRTLEGNVWRYRYDLPDELVQGLDAILTQESVRTDLHRSPATFQRIVEALGAQAPVERIWEGPAWRFPNRIISSDDVPVVTVSPGMRTDPWFPWLAEELDAWRPCRAVLNDDDIIAVCFSSRNSTVAAEAGVETAEAFRGRGYATAAVAAWARAVRDEGRIPLYSTSWDNHASQAVASKLGLILYGVDLHLT